MLICRLFKGVLAQNNSVISGVFKKRLLPFFAFVAILLTLTSGKAQAQPFGTDLSTLRDYINGNGSAIAAIHGETYTFIPCYDPYGYCTFDYSGVAPGMIGDITAALGGAAAATNLLNLAIGGDAGALNTIQATIGGGFASAYSSQGTDIVNTWAAGTGVSALRTLQAAFAGNAAATAVLNVVSDSRTGTWLNVIRSLLQATSNANAIAIIESAIGGNGTDMQRVNVAVFGLISTFNADPNFDQVARGWLSTVVNSTGGTPALPDMDGDGLPDIYDPDMDGDGTPNEYDDDANGNGTADDTETDTDQDGITDNLDPDIDDDGIPNADDPDDDGDGLDDGYETDTDGDGTLDYQDDDIDGDGQPNDEDQDDDGDGIDDTSDVDSEDQAGNNDADGDGVMSSCGSATADLTGTFNEDPCELTEDGPLSSDMQFAKDNEAGQKLVDYLEDWWMNQYLPAMRNMTAQLHASVIDQSRNIGSMMDSQGLTRAARATQEVELEAKKRNVPNEVTCVAGSHGPAMAGTLTAAQVITQGFKADVAKEGSGAPGTAGAVSSAADQKSRFDQYCTFFHNQASNGGITGCPGAPAPDGSIVDGDIDIEGILLADTLDLADADTYTATLALMRNLVQPKSIDKMPENMVNTSIGRERLIRIQYIKGLRNIASDTIASIIARRAGIELPDVATAAATVVPPNNTPAVAEPPGTPPAPPSTPGSGVAVGDYNAFLLTLRQRESSNNYTITGGAGGKFAGAYQMGNLALIEAGCIVDNAAARANNGPNTYNWTGRCGGQPINSLADFLTGPNAVAAQNAAIAAHNRALINQLRSKGTDKYMCQTVGGILMTPSGMIAAAHLIGAGALNRCLANPATTGSPCQDAFGTGWKEYAVLGQNYESPWGGACDGSNVTPPVAGSDPTATNANLRQPIPAKDTIRQIREAAGVDPADIADNPSYNEIMLALTKERFFDPEYFVRMNNSIGAIKQEQTAVNAYISMMSQDIYTMQERINALLAARASLGYNADPVKNAIPDTPMR